MAIEVVSIDKDAGTDENPMEDVALEFDAAHC